MPGWWTGAHTAPATVPQRAVGAGFRRFNRSSGPSKGLLRNYSDGRIRSARLGVTQAAAPPKSFLRGHQVVPARTLTRDRGVLELVEIGPTLYEVEDTFDRGSCQFAVTAGPAHQA